MRSIARENMRSHPKALTVRFSEPEFVWIEAQARAHGEKPAEWVRSRCMEETGWEGRLLAELRATQQLVAELVREVVVYTSGGNNGVAGEKIRSIFEKAAALRAK
jgi:hypothetical protein